MFSTDWLIYRIFNMLYRYLMLNFLFLVFSIPIITMPAASAALFTVVRKEVYHEEPALIRSFWQGFRDNWRHASIVGFLFLLVGWVWWEDVQTLTRSRIPFSSLISIVMLIMAIVFSSILLHIFPLMVHVRSTLKQLFINALKLSIVKPHLTLVNLIAMAGLLLLCMRYAEFFALGFFSLTATMTYWLVNRKFERVGAVYSNSSSSP